MKTKYTILNVFYFAALFAGFSQTFATIVDFTDAVVPADQSYEDYSGDQAVHSTFIRSTAIGVTFEGTNLTWADFTDANLTGAKFNNANLTDVDFTGTTVTGVDFRGATGFTNTQLYSTSSYATDKIFVGDKPLGNEHGILGF